VFSRGSPPIGIWLGKQIESQPSVPCAARISQAVKSAQATGVASRLARRNLERAIEHFASGLIERRRRRYLPMLAQVKELRVTADVYSKCQGCNHVRAARARTRKREKERDAESRQWRGTVESLFCHVWLRWLQRASPIARYEKRLCLNVSGAPRLLLSLARAFKVATARS